MSRYQVKEDCSYLGETWGGYFTLVTTDYGWAKKQMEYKFMEYLKKYKSNQPKVSIGKTRCKLDMGTDGKIEIIIEDLNQSGGDADVKRSVCCNE